MSTPTNTSDSSFFSAVDNPAERQQYPARFPQIKLEVSPTAGEFIPYEEVESTLSAWEKSAQQPAVIEAAPMVLAAFKKAAPIVASVTTLAGLGYVIFLYWQVILIGIVGSFVITSVIWHIAKGRRSSSGTYDSGAPSSQAKAGSNGVNVFVNQSGQGNSNQSHININL